MMTPILLKGHERPLTVIKFNREGDLLFTCAKDKEPCLWWTATGERIGTYVGHKGAVFHMDVDYNSKRLVTAAADETAKLWEVETGKLLKTFVHESPVRSVDWSCGDQLILTAQAKLGGKSAVLRIFRISENSAAQLDTPLKVIMPDADVPIQRALWGPLNDRIYTANDDGSIRIYDPETGKQLMKADIHKKSIRDMQWDKTQTVFITASSDKTAKLVDTRSLEVIKTYNMGRPVNSAAISPLKDHIVAGGGESSVGVALSRHDTSQFKSCFFHKIYQYELASVEGHFGPVNTLAFSPDGKSYASGSEDGFVRLHHFGKEYLNRDL